MAKQIELINGAGDRLLTRHSKYILRFNSGANISLDLNDKLTSAGIVARGWFGNQEWQPSSEGSCSLVITPSAGNCIWLKPLILVGTSLFDVKVKAVATKLPKIYSVVDSQELLVPDGVQQILLKDKTSDLEFIIQLPVTNISSVFYEAIQITTGQRGIICEPKAANLWVFALNN